MTEIKVNRAPFLALWAKVVARRLGFTEQEALTLGKAISGLTAQAKGRKLGIYQARPAGERAQTAAKREEQGVDWLEFMGRLVPILRDESGIRAVSGTSPIDPAGVQRYLQAKFKEHLPLVEEKLTELARAFPPEQLEERAMDLYMELRPPVPAGRAGWGKAGVLDLEKVDRMIATRRAADHRPQA
ncbi:MAG: hypothetical protein ACP5G2_02350 [Candidatus Bipolaricaulaceae bacterium]